MFVSLMQTEDRVTGLNSNFGLNGTNFVVGYEMPPCYWYLVLLLSVVCIYYIVAYPLRHYLYHIVCILRRYIQLLCQSPNCIIPFTPDSAKSKIDTSFFQNYKLGKTEKQTALQ